jgi:hypothetical protein
MKTIVTHYNPDLDAVTACWLIHKFLSEWQDAEVKFVAAGKILEDVTDPDNNQDIIHVDTGSGKFDHHQTNENTCAAKLVYDDLVKKNLIHEKLRPALERLIAFVNLTDHFGEVHFPDAPADVYDLSLHQLVVGLNHTESDKSKAIYVVSILLEGALQIFRNKIRAEEEIKNGIVFESKWGKSLAMQTRNEEAMKLGMKMGYELVMRQDPQRGGIRIKTLPSNKSDLCDLYNRVISIDQKGSWYLHPSHNLLLNSSSINPALIPTTLTLTQLIEIIKEIR